MPDPVSKLTSYLAGHFPHRITEGEVVDLVESLRDAGYLAIGEKGAVTYELPLL